VITPGKSSVELKPQKHGGALQVGNPGNKGGPGRPPSELRQILRMGFSDAIPELARIAKEGITERDRISAIDKLAKYGLGEEKGWSHDLVAALVRDIADIIERHVSDGAVLKAIEANLKESIRRHMP